MQVNATIMVGFLVLASVASLFPVEPLDFRVLEDRNSQDHQELKDRIAAISRSGLVLQIVGIMIAPFGFSILMSLVNHRRAARYSTMAGIVLVLALIFALSTLYIWFGGVLNNLLESFPSD